MTITRLYNVADHVFRLILPETLSCDLCNYEPFAVEQGTPIFSLEVSQEDYIRPTNLSHVFTDSSDEDMPRIEVYHVEEDWLFGVSMQRETPVVCQLLTTNDFKQAHLFISPDLTDIRFAIDNAAMLLYAFRTASLNTLEMHASVIIKDEYAQLFLGHSGTGKSTHSRLWQKAFPDARLLNDDNPVLRVLPNKEVRVYGSPWSGKTPCYQQASAPVRGFVKLTQAPKNEIRLLRLPESYVHMLSSCSGLKIDPEMMNNLYSTIAAAIQIIPTYELKCLPNTDAARLCHDTLTK